MSGIFDEEFRKLKDSFKERQIKLAWLGAYGVKEYDPEHRRATRDFDAITLPSEVPKVKAVLQSLGWKEIVSILPRKGELTFLKRVRGRGLKLDLYLEGRLFDFSHPRVEYDLSSTVQRLCSDPLPPSKLAISKFIMEPPLADEHNYDLTRLLLKADLNPDEFKQDLERNFWLQRRVKRNLVALEAFVKRVKWLNIREKKEVLKKIKRLI